MQCCHSPGCPRCHDSRLNSFENSPLGSLSKSRGCPTSTIWPLFRTATWSKSSKVWILCATIITVQPWNDSRMTFCTLPSVSGSKLHGSLVSNPVMVKIRNRARGIIIYEHTCLQAHLKSRFCSSLAELWLDRIVASGPEIECSHLTWSLARFHRCHYSLL